MSVVKEIKERLDIVELISEHVQLERAGHNYKGLCPFHEERTPSFVVFPDTNTWHCFGACSEGGDIFTFVMKQEGWDFRTALEELARRAGVELQPRTQQEETEAQEHARLHEILSVAANYYHHLLLNAPQAQGARDYVAQRKLQERILETFQIGYALDEWHALQNFLRSKGYATEELIQAGLLVEREDSTGKTSRVYDRFRGRLMIPIHDHRGRVIGFGARTLDPKGVPKYLNSPQTPLFDKSNTLYGLHSALKGIRAAERAVIVEGYMDVLQAYQAGFTNVVAQLGTALTEQNLRRLTRYAPRVILALDPDTAGQTATMRGLDVARETLGTEWEPVFDARGLTHMEARLSADIRVLTLPAGQDPDDLIREDPARWAVLVSQARPLVEHYMRMVLQDQDLVDPKVKASVTQTLVPVIRQVPSPVERAHYAQKLARTLRVDERSLLDMVAGPTRQRQHHRKTKPAPQVSEGKRRTDLETYCLRGFLQAPHTLNQANALLAQLGLKAVSVDDFYDSENREIYRAWQALINQDSTPSPEQLNDAVPEQLQARLNKLLDMPSLTLRNQKWLLDAQAEPGQDAFDLRPEELQQDFMNSLLRLRERNLHRRSIEIRFLLEEATAVEARLYQHATSETSAALLQLHRMLSGTLGNNNATHPEQTP